MAKRSYKGSRSSQRQESRHHRRRQRHRAGGRHRLCPRGRRRADLLLDEDEDARETKRLVEDAGQKSRPFRGDIQDPEQCRAIIAKAVKELGGIDILVNNAAHQASFKSIDENQRRGVGADLQGQHPRDVLSDQGGRSSHEAGQLPSSTPRRSIRMRPTRHFLAYATTKGAIQNFTAGLAQIAGRERHSCQRGRAGADLDAAHPLDPAEDAVKISANRSQ